MAMMENANCPPGARQMPAAGDDEIDGFKGFYFMASGRMMPYRLFVPAPGAAGTKFPLTVFFHGMGSVGSDNRAQLNLAGKFSKAAQSRTPCFVLAPQCPKDARWVNSEWAAERYPFQAEPTWPMGLAMELIEHILRSYPVDPARLYVGGASMGGFATWDILARCSGKFAAGFPICGGGDVATVARLAPVPLWVFHGAQDTCVPVAASRAMVAALQAAGARPRYTEYPAVRHDSWQPALATPELYDWLFGNTKSSQEDRSC